MRGGVYIRRKNIEEQEWTTINPQLDTYKTFCSEFSFNDTNYMDFDWIEAQLNYINGLTEIQKNILYSYTKYGDVLINHYLRNTLTDEIIETTKQQILRSRNHPFANHTLLQFNSRDTLINSLYMIVNELRNILIHAPKLKKPIKVFRGIKSTTHLHSNKKSGFLSTTLYLPSTELFMLDNCCLLELYLSPEIPCLFIAPISNEPGEYEILLIDNCTVINNKQTIKKFLDIPDYHTEPNLLAIASQYELDEKTVFECSVIK